ncbi:MAG: DUF222 domain-containing protein [bacterium]|nr:DUF222 domain-containing protein [bacterium]
MTSGQVNLRSTGEVLSVVVAALAAVDHGSRRNATHAERLEWLSVARDAVRRMDGLLTTLVAEADRAGSSTVVAGTPTTTYMAQDGRTSSKEATTAVLRAKDVASRKAVQRATLSGEIGTGQAAAITKLLRELPRDLTAEQKETAEEFLLNKAATTPAAGIPRLRKAALEAARPETEDTREAEMQRLEEQRRRAVRNRSLRFDDDGDGSITFRGSLPYLEAEGFQKLIEAYVESRRRTARRNGNDEYTTTSQRQADALTDLVAQHAAANGQSDSRLPQLGGEIPRVHVTMREADLRLLGEQAGLLESGAEISPGELRRLICDAELVPAVLGTGSEVLDLGMSARLVSPKIRRALVLRDGGCAFPSCDARAARCEAHHIVPWWNGGPTALTNLVLLCPHHHGIVEPPRFHSRSHPNRWTVRIGADGLPEFTRPKGLEPLDPGRGLASAAPTAPEPLTPLREPEVLAAVGELEPLTGWPEPDSSSDPGEPKPLGGGRERQSSSDPGEPEPSPTERQLGDESSPSDPRGPSEPRPLWPDFDNPGPPPPWAMVG